MEPELCEYCGERPGVTNSRYWLFDLDDDEGGWVCGVCEQEFEADYEETMRERDRHYEQPKAD